LEVPGAFDQPVLFGDKRRTPPPTGPLAQSGQWALEYCNENRRLRGETVTSIDSTPATPALEMRGISKTFTGVRALRDVRLKAWGGEILALMGENGAGKSTLMKILSGAHRADPGGEILIDGKPVVINGPHDAKNAGIAIIYQELALAPNLSVAENIYLGSELRRPGYQVDRKTMEAKCAPILQRLGAPFGPRSLVGGLSIAEQQMVEIARALHGDSKILVLDEPTTALSSRETEHLFRLVRQLRTEGIAIIYISHRMAEVYELADRVTVLRDGSYAGSLDRTELSAEAIVRMMVGRDLSSFYTKEHDPDIIHPHVVLEVDGLTDGGRRVKPCSFKLNRGEVLGLAGLVGAGRTELARLIFGADRKAGGSVKLEGQEVSIRNPAEALDRGIAYLTEDRKALGLFLDMSCGANINLGVIGRDAKGGMLLDRNRARSRSADSFRNLRVRAASALVSVGSLSGGNQQKILLARLLETGPKVLILDEPTRGVDVGAKSEIYRIIDELARKGIAILVISSELPEIIGICDRVLVMREGHIAGIVGGPDGEAINQENIMAHAAGMAA
jgi:ribose transport system ATP-binding protein